MTLSRSRSGTDEVASTLTGLVATLAPVAAMMGLVLDGAYTGSVATAEMLRGFDLVTVVIVVPGLVWAMFASRNGSVFGRLASASLLAYLAYTYAYYLFGTPFNDLFLLHVVGFSGSLYALVLTFVLMSTNGMAWPAPSRTSTRVASVALGLLALGLGGMWVYYSLAEAVTGDVPPGSALVETSTIVHLGIVLDLALLVPAYAAAAVLAWRRHDWGYILATVLLASGTLHQISYMVALVFQSSAGVPGAVAFDAAEPVILLIYVLGMVVLQHGAHIGTPRQSSTDADPDASAGYSSDRQQAEHLRN